MTDATTPDPPQPPVTVTPDPEAEAPARGERLGTILMGVAIAGCVILVIDVAMKGRLLAPLFALLPVPKASRTAPEGEPDAGLPDASG